jgi:methylglutaconyl-CoA hydratase
MPDSLADLETSAARIVALLLANGLPALAGTKALAMESAFGGIGIEDEAHRCLVRMHAARRQTPEASERLASSAEKRAANRTTGQT